MHKRDTSLLVVALLFSVCVSTSYARTQQNTSGQNFAAACGIGAAVLGVIGGVAAWYFSESDEQLIARFESECCHCDMQYGQMMRNLERLFGIYAFPIDARMLLKNTPETIVYDIATQIRSSDISQSTYRHNVLAVKKQLQSTISTINKRIRDLENKNRTYDEHKNMQILRRLSSNGEELMNHVALFADFLEHHKGYFNLYGTVNELRDNYVRAFAIVEQGGIYAEDNLKNAVICAYGGSYPFRQFVDIVGSDIGRLRIGLNNLRYSYSSGRSYASTMLNQLVWMKNVVLSDYRYTQECYQWEQEQLQRLQLEAWRQQTEVMRQQNRLMQQHNALKQCELSHQYDRTDVSVIVHL